MASILGGFVRQHLAVIVAGVFLVQACDSVYLDVHIPLPEGCVKYNALLANRLLRRSNSHEEVNLFSTHQPHITLYLADFELEQTDDDEVLNQTRVAEMKDDIEKTNFTQILSNEPSCQLSLQAAHNDPSLFYFVNGAYTMLPVQKTDCLQILSDTVLSALKSYIRKPVKVPSWVNDLPESERIAAINRVEKYGSPNVKESFSPHITVGYDTESSEAFQAVTTSKIEVMDKWNSLYKPVQNECVDEALAIALGRNGEGGTVLANARMGYWELPKKREKKSPGVAEQ
mmetsp:Transcript_30479/g.72499  ORF Transcript_30479/g.72499 Transcript_30479/m.72499 type:complete len:286 (-) Transcript_30479:1504-2361(-)